MYEKEVVNEKLLIECIQVDQEYQNMCRSPRADREKKDCAVIDVATFPQIEKLSISFRNIAVMENLDTFRSLRELRLDNNKIKKIENLEYCCNLTWLGNYLRLTEVLSGSLHGTLLRLVFQ
eukprot:GHVU01061435.1.p1 GENE.GHVU01061435.1~~GHVU01061435.1.p1  ORF type:complete len:121 (-),score=14.73 GHVU01061435.1:948-1310(-)